MKSKTIIAGRGVANTGKSATIKIVYSLLKELYPTAIIEELHMGVDLTVVMTIDDLKVGMESQGDPNSRLFNSLDHFVKIGCKVIVCATRSRGATVEAVNSLAGDFLVEWFPKVSISSASNHEAANRSDAQQIVAAVRAAIDA
jgi:hypothetical protein